MTTEASKEITSSDISASTSWTFKSESSRQHVQALKDPEAVLRVDAPSPNIGVCDTGDVPPAHALALSWDDANNVKNPLNWSPWWKYGIIALVSFIELLTEVLTFPNKIFLANCCPAI